MNSEMPAESLSLLPKRPPQQRCRLRLNPNGMSADGNRRPQLWSAASFETSTIHEDENSISAATNPFYSNSPTASISSLPLVDSIPPSSRRFSRSQTGPQLSNRGPWSRYALSRQSTQKSVDSSISSLPSTTSSTAVLLPQRHSFSHNIITPITQTSHQLSLSPRDELNETKWDQSMSGTLHFNGELIEPAQVLLSPGNNGRRSSLTSVWKRAGRSAGKQMRQMVDHLRGRSASTGRLDSEEEDPRIIAFQRQLSGPTRCPMKPPFFAYKVLPYIWIGDLRSAESIDLLSDGGTDHETRRIRRRVFADFRTEKGQPTGFSWPKQRPNVLDYCLVIQRRSKITRKQLFNAAIESCKIVNKARRDPRDATQVLIYGSDAYNIPQLMVIAYLIAMFDQNLKTASELVARSAPSVHIDQSLVRWFLEFREFLDKKEGSLGRLKGDMVRVKKAEAERSFDRRFVIIRWDSHLTPDWEKFVQKEDGIAEERNSPKGVFSLKLPADYGSWRTETEDEPVFETIEPLPMDVQFPRRRTPKALFP